MATADRPINKWRGLAQTAEPREIFDARLNAFIPPAAAKVEERRHELHDDLFAGRRWRVRWRDSEGCWQVDGIPPRWWRNYDDIDWLWSALARPDGLLRVQIYDADDDQVVSEPSPPADQPVVVVISEQESLSGRRTARPEREKGKTGPRPTVMPRVLEEMGKMNPARLKGMKHAEMESVFKASPDTCTKARDKVLGNSR
jgi:hypothetical protein